MDDRGAAERGVRLGQRQDVPFEFDEKWEAGEHKLTFELEPLTPAGAEQKTGRWTCGSSSRAGPRAAGEGALGPAEELRAVLPEGRARGRGRAARVRPRSAGEVRHRAFRRPVDDRTVDRLVALAESGLQPPGKAFEAGVAQAMVAVLASPRFLFREEDGRASRRERPSAASTSMRWRRGCRTSCGRRCRTTSCSGSAEQGKLRENLPAQVERMLADRGRTSSCENFVGQWLQARDVEAIAINARVGAGPRRAATDRRARSGSRDARSASCVAQDREAHRARSGRRSSEARPRRAVHRRPFRPAPQFELNGDLRRAMRRETEMRFEHIVREDRSCWS